ncbi:hypothetical protein Tco_0540422 [Tanacetum coccineum]
MSGTHLVAGDYRWGKNPLRSFPSEYSPATCRWGYLSPATCRWGYLSPATCRWGKPRHVAREKGDCRQISADKQILADSKEIRTKVDEEQKQKETGIRRAEAQTYTDSVERSEQRLTRADADADLDRQHIQTNSRFRQNPF